MRRSVPWLSACDLLKILGQIGSWPWRFEHLYRINAVNFDMKNPWSMILMEKRVDGEDMPPFILNRKIRWVSGFHRIYWAVSDIEEQTERHAVDSVIWGLVFLETWNPSYNVGGYFPYFRIYRVCRRLYWAWEEEDRADSYAPCLATVLEKVDQISIPVTLREQL